MFAASAATGMKVLSWAVAAAVVYRQLGEAAFAVLAMTRATLGLLNYTTFGLGPALTRLVAEAERTPDEGEVSVNRGPTVRRSDELDRDDEPRLQERSSEASVLEEESKSTEPPGSSDLRTVGSRLTDADQPTSASRGLTARRSDHAAEARDRRAARPRLGDQVLDYAKPEDALPPMKTVLPPLHPESPARAMQTTEFIVLPLCLIGMVLVCFYANGYDRLHDLAEPRARWAEQLAFFVGFLGFGLLTRLAGDAVAGASHGMQRVAADQIRAAACDALWVLLCLGTALVWSDQDDILIAIAFYFAATGLLSFLWRKALAGLLTDAGRLWFPKPSPAISKKLLAYGGLVTLGSAADFLYAPIDYFILNRLVDPLAPAVYAPAVQIDAAILVLVSAVATVALPNVARLAAAKDHRGIRRAYLRGSLVAGAAATGIGLAAWGLSPWVFQLWLGDDLPATRAILPLILLHTVLGSAAGVGRATLIATGHAGQYAVMVLIGGAINVGLSLWFVRLGWGIEGVVLGTVASVGLRCLIATPWLVWRMTRGR
jgi:O-antigen/teichoic acid export membrane protein